jgi:thiol-disulfide isomerase/thioredoxin
MRDRSSRWIIPALSMIISVCVHAAPATLSLGSPAPDFDLKGFVVAEQGAATDQPSASLQIKERQYSLADFDRARVLVLIFTCNHCPTAQAYEKRIMQLVNDYKARAVAIVAITSNNPQAVRLDELGYTDLGDSYEDTQIRALERGFNFPYLYDGDKQAVAQAYGPAATPHVFVFDRARKLRYTGRIDNAENPAELTQQETRDAIEALLAGRAPAVTTTRTFGCSLKWADKIKSAERALKAWNQEQVNIKSISASAVKELVENKTDRLRLVNVWATWCGPCVVEFPELVTINRMYRNRAFEMISINLDVPARQAQAQAFLQKQAASFRNYIYDSSDKDALADALDPSWNGAMPHTVLIAPDGRIIYRHTGMIDALEVKRAIVGFVGRYFFKPAQGVDL